MNKKQLINQLKNDVCCRLQPCKYGIGVFAIKDIPAGTNPFVGCDESQYIPITEEELKDIDATVMALVHDMLVFEDGSYYFPARGLQSIDISYFLNHSKEPNMEADILGENFYTIRIIDAGEELFVDYDTYDSNKDGFR